MKKKEPKDLENESVLNTEKADSAAEDEALNSRVNKSSDDKVRNEGVENSEKVEKPEELEDADSEEEKSEAAPKKEKSGVWNYLSTLIFEEETQNTEGEEEDAFPKKGLLSYLLHPPKSEDDDGSFSFSKLADRYRQYKKKEEQDIVNRSVYREIVNASRSTHEYWVLVFFSCIIASFGLLQNSSATIIGAMIIAPLMGPIMGLSMGTVWGDFRLFVKTLKVILASAFISVFIAMLMGYLVPVLEIPHEILSRSLPGLFDLGVALACGFVGAYAITSKSIASAVPGVAISVALMPPLCTTGIGVGMGNPEIAAGSFILFLTNLLGISFSACIVFWFKKVHPGDEDVKQINARVSRHIRVTSALLLLTAIPLAYFSYNAHIRTSEKIKVKQLITDCIPAKYLSKYSLLSSSVFNKSSSPSVEEGLILKLELYSPFHLQSGKIQNLKSKLKNIVKKPVQIQITRLRTDIQIY